jgi:hypothetical protein
VNGAHSGDLLSALADGALTVGEADQVRAHVAGCASCAAELAEVERARTILRGLPPVDPPFGFFERLLLRRRWRDGIAAVLSGAAAAVLVAGLLIGPPAAGSAAASVASLPWAHLAGRTSPPPTVAAPRVGIAPVSLAAGTIYRRVATVQHGDGFRVIYSDGARQLSLFEQAGSLDPERLAGASTANAITIKGHRGIEYRWPNGSVVAWEASGRVYAVVAEGPASVARQAAAAVPSAPKAGYLDRLRGACRDLLRGFGA